MIAEITSIPFLVTIGAIVAAIAAGWGQIKSFLLWIKGLAFVTVSIRLDDPLQNAIRLYCIKNFKETKLGSRSFGAFFRLVYAIRRTQLVGIETLSPQGVVYWNQRRPLLMKLVLTTEGYPRNMSLTFIRGTWDIDQFIENALEYYNTTIGAKVEGFQRHRIVYVFGKNKQQLEVQIGNREPSNTYWRDNGQEQYLNHKLIKWDLEDLIPASHEAALSDLALPPDAKAMIELARKWIKNEKWFYSHHVPWRMGVLAHGEAGTGKTALFRAIAQELNLPLYVFDLASLSNEELFIHWRAMLSNAPCMALIEDMDTVFEGRKNVSGVENGLTFNSLLNCIDGVERCDGLFLAITTNKPEMIDSAIGVVKNGDKIASRPGRIDYIIEMPRLTKEGRIELAKRILIDCPKNIERIVAEGKGDTGAQFQERCSRFAIESFKNEK